jgi:hypothetical protein
VERSRCRDTAQPAVGRFACQLSGQMPYPAMSVPSVVSARAAPASAAGTSHRLPPREATPEQLPIAQPMGREETVPRLVHQVGPQERFRPGINSGIESVGGRAGDGLSHIQYQEGAQ